MSLQTAQDNMAYLRVVFSGTVVPIGIVTNILAWYIFSRKALNSKDVKHGHMNGLLCFFNMLALSSSILLTQFLPFFNIYLVRLSDPACKLFNLWLRFTLQVPSCHQCLVTFLFYLSIKYPAKSKFMYEKGFILKSMTVMFAFVLLANSEYFWYYLTITLTTSTYYDPVLNQTMNQTVVSSVTCGSGYIAAMAGDYINILMRCFLPFIILLVLNTLILQQVAKTKRNISDPGSLQAAQNKKNKNEVRFGRILLFLNFLFLIMYLPWACSFIASYALSNSGVRLTNLNDGSNNIGLLYFYNIAYCLSFCYNSSPFFVNLGKNEFNNLI